MFKAKYSIRERMIESNRIRTKYPLRVPVICERSSRSDGPLLDKNKYLVPQELSLRQFMFVIRKRLKLKQEQAISLFIHNKVPQTSQLLSEAYEENKDKNGLKSAIIRIICITLRICSLQREVCSPHVILR